MGYEMSPSNMDLFSDGKKGKLKHQKHLQYVLISNLLDDAGADNTTYQNSSPYNNNLDLNELLQGDLCSEQIDALQN